jgi:hypothetical protein
VTLVGWEEGPLSQGRRSEQKSLLDSREFHGAEKSGLTRTHHRVFHAPQDRVNRFIELNSQMIAKIDLEVMPCV